MATDQGYGIDVSILSGPEKNDLDFTFNEVSDGATILLQDIWKGITTPSAPVVVIDDQPPAPILFWETPPVSFDIRDYFNDSITPTDASVIQSRIQQIYVDDLRFQTLNAAVAFGGQDRTLRVDIAATAQTGLHLRLVVTAGSDVVTVEQVS